MGKYVGFYRRVKVSGRLRGLGLRVFGIRDLGIKVLLLGGLGFRVRGLGSRA